MLRGEVRAGLGVERGSVAGGVGDGLAGCGAVAVSAVATVAVWAEPPGDTGYGRDALPGRRQDRAAAIANLDRLAMPGPGYHLSSTPIRCDWPGAKRHAQIPFDGTLGLGVLEARIKTVFDHSPLIGRGCGW